MQTNIYRRKLLNAVLFFAKNTRHLNTTKLSKLLYFLDFTHFKQTGYPSIGLNYYAFHMGPVPKDFWLEVRDGKVPEDFKGKLVLVTKRDDVDPGFKEIEFQAKAKPDMSIFTPREATILEKLAFVFKDARARDMSEVSHLPKQPWDITIRTHGENHPIDYLLSIDETTEVSLDYARESLADYRETARNLHLKPTK